MKRILALLIFLAAVGFVSQAKAQVISPASILQWSQSKPVGNPPTGSIYMYFDPTSGNLTCVNSSGSTTVCNSLPQTTTANQCLLSTSTAWSTVWGSCSGSASSNWNAIVPGTGTISAGTYNIGTGSTLTTTGSGAINATTVPLAGISGLGANVGTFLATPSSANLAAAITGATGTGALVFGTAPTITLANGTGLPISTGVSGLGTGVATFLATPSSANLATALTDEIGSGKAVFATALQGTDANLLTAGTISGTAATLCTDANGGATTVGCSSGGSGLSGMTASQVPIAATATTVTSSKAIQGTDSSLLSSGTVSGTGNALCTDANGGATTTGCPSGGFTPAGNLSGSSTTQQVTTIGNVAGLAAPACVVDGLTSGHTTIAACETTLNGFGFGAAGTIYSFVPEDITSDPFVNFGGQIILFYQSGTGNTCTSTSTPNCWRIEAPLTLPTHLSVIGQQNPSRTQGPFNSGTVLFPGPSYPAPYGIPLNATSWTGTGNHIPDFSCAATGGSLSNGTYYISVAVGIDRTGGVGTGTGTTSTKTPGLSAPTAEVAVSCANGGSAQSITFHAPTATGGSGSGAFIGKDFYAFGATAAAVNGASQAQSLLVTSQWTCGGCSSSFFESTPMFGFAIPGTSQVVTIKSIPTLTAGTGFAPPLVDLSTCFITFGTGVPGFSANSFDARLQHLTLSGAMGGTNTTTPASNEPSCMLNEWTAQEDAGPDDVVGTGPWLGTTLYSGYKGGNSFAHQFQLPSNDGPSPAVVGPFTASAINTTGVVTITSTAGCASNGCAGPMNRYSITGFTNASNNLVNQVAVASSATTLDFSQTTISETHAATVTGPLFYPMIVDGRGLGNGGLRTFEDSTIANRCSGCSSQPVEPYSIWLTGTNVGLHAHGIHCENDVGGDCIFVDNLASIDISGLTGFGDTGKYLAHGTSTADVFNIFITKAGKNGAVSDDSVPFTKSVGANVGYVYNKQLTSSQLVLAQYAAGSTSPLCPNGTNGALTTSGCVTGSGTINNASQYSAAYYSASGTTNTISGLAAPTAPSNVPQVLTSTNSSGSAAAPAWLPAGVTPRASTCTSNADTVLATDRSNYVTWSDASACAVTLPQANSTGFATNFFFKGCNIGAGTATITPTTSTISYTTGLAYTSAASSLALTTGQCALIMSDNTNYFANQFTGGSGGGVTSFTGDGTLLNNSASTGAVTATLATAGAHKYFGNNTGSTAAPAYDSIATGDLPTGIPIANVGTSGLSGTAPVTISAAGAIGCATCVTSAASLANGGVVLGTAGTQASATNTQLTFATSTLTVGLAGTGTGIVALGGATSGTATMTGPAVAGTTTNPIVFSNAIAVGTAPTVTTPGTGFAVFGTDGTGPASIAAGTSGTHDDSTSNCRIIWNNAVNMGCIVGTTGTQTITGKSIAASEVNSGTLAVANGGTNLASGTSGGILGYTGTGTLASSALLATNALVVGGGAGATPATGNADFTYATHTLTGAAAGLVDFSAITGATGFKVPVQAGATAGANGVVGYDSTNDNTHERCDNADCFAVSDVLGGSIDLTGQTAAKAATNLFLPTITRMVRVSGYLKVTTAATTSSILGGTTGIVITYTDGTDSVAQSVTLGCTSQAGNTISIGTGNTGNATTTVSYCTGFMFAKAAGQMQYAIGYTSVGGTAMAYEAHLRTEAF